MLSLGHAQDKIGAISFQRTNSATSQVRARVDEELDEVEVAAGGGGVERGPLLGVGGVGVAAVRDQQLHHLLAVVDAALKVWWDNE